MPTLANHQSNSATKLLLIGDSGSGKTGALASLALAGYNLRILDFDNGLDILSHFIKKGDTTNKNIISNVIYETLTDKHKAVAGKTVIDGIPQAFQRGMNLLTEWKVGGDNPYNLGKITAWGSKDVLVIDSLTFCSEAAMRHVLAINGRGSNPPQIQDWGEAMRMIEGMLGLLYSSAISCNVIVTAHIAFLGDEGGMTRGYPSTLGQKLPPKVGRYFNSVLMARAIGAGAAAKRKIITRSEGLIELKNSAPTEVPAMLDLGTGLAEFFKLTQSN